MQKQIILTRDGKGHKLIDVQLRRNGSILVRCWGCENGPTAIVGSLDEALPWIERHVQDSVRRLTMASGTQ